VAETAIGARLERQIRERAARAAAFAAVKMETELRAAFQPHRKSGDTQRSISVRRSLITPTRIEYVARVTTPQSSWVNDGTPPHRITPRDPNGVLRFQWPGAPAHLVHKDGFVYLKGVDHPGYAGDGWWDNTIRRWHEFLVESLT